MYCFLGFRSSTANGFGHDFFDQKFQNNLIKIRIAKTIWDSTKTDSAMSSNFDKNLKTDFENTLSKHTGCVYVLRCIEWVHYGQKLPNFVQNI